jgi:hypothetical protein
VRQMSPTFFTMPADFSSDLGIPERLVEGVLQREREGKRRSLWMVQTKVRTIRAGLSNLGILCKSRKVA